MGDNISELKQDTNSTQAKKMYELRWRNEDLNVTQYVMGMAMVMAFSACVVAVNMFISWIQFVNVDISHNLAQMCCKLAL